MIENNKVYISVCGLHMKNFALNKQLLDIGAIYIKTVSTSPNYKLYALPTYPEKPGMVKVENGGTSIEVEVWELTYEALGKFLSIIPSPLGLGKISLEDGTQVIGFICEPYVIKHSIDISFYKGWRYYCLSKS